MKVINVAIKKDGKVEQDTFFTDGKIDQSLATDISVAFGCDVIITVVGSFRPLKFAEQTVYYGECPKAEVVDA